MHALSSEQILNVWEAARGQHELDRALTLLAAGEAEAGCAELAELPLGERDARLLRLRALTLGPALNGFDVCPGCGEHVEFQLDTTALAQPRELLPETCELRVNGFHVRYRLPTSRDLAEVATAPTTAEGVSRLLARCIVGKTGNGVTADGAGEQAVAIAGLPAEIIDALGVAIADADPSAEILFALQCPSCAHTWQALFEIVGFFWKEIEAQACRLLREIDVLARSYGWSEREILGLSTLRRQSYLEIIGA